MCSGRHMQTLAPIVAGSGDDQNIVVDARLNGLAEKFVRLFRARGLSTTDINDMRAVLDRLKDRPRQIELRADNHSLALGIRKNRKEEAPASRRDAGNRTARLPKNDAGDVRAMRGCGTVIGICVDQGWQPCQRCAAETRM